jgi:hypothetical protein
MQLGRRGSHLAYGDRSRAAGLALLVRHRARVPSVDPSAYVAPSAELIGRVTVGPRARAISGAVATRLG